MTTLKSWFFSLRVWWLTLISSHRNSLITHLQLAGATVGSNVFIGPHVYVELENAPLLTIEDDVVIADFTKIILHDSSVNNVVGGPVLFGKVLLRQNCYIGADCLLMPGSEVAKNTIVGAGSLVKGRLKANSVYVGRPAKRIGSISQLTQKWRKTKLPLTTLVASPKWHQRSARDIAELDPKKLKF